MLGGNFASPVLKLPRRIAENGSEPTVTESIQEIVSRRDFRVRGHVTQSSHFRLLDGIGALCTTRRKLKNILPDEARDSPTTLHCCFRLFFAYKILTRARKRQATLRG